MNSLTPAWRERLWISGAVVLAVVLGVQIAQGGWLLPGLLGAGVVLFTLYRLKAESLGSFVLAGLLAGYFIGNRGFAQLMPAPSIPLLPAEAALATLVALQVLERIRGGLTRRIHWIDALIVAWVVFGIARMVFDARMFGIVAVRDFAMVYYAVFFFLAANIVHRDFGKLSVLMGTLRIASVIMGILFFMTLLWPNVLESTLTLRGVPVIFYKADLVGIFAGIGALLHFIRFEQTGRWHSVGFSLLLVGVVLATNNRSALLALTVGAAALGLAGRWRFPALLAGGAVVATVFLVAVASWRGDDWRDTPLIEAYERVVSLVDPLGTGNYQGEETANKGDNNRFRLVWWTEVINETLDTSPVFGLGFGYDLAARFQRVYYGVFPEDFNARSPHSIVITVFARMGAIGLGLFLGIVAQMVVWVWRAARRNNLEQLGPALMATMVFTGACFGVVLEGPMGAVVFWVMLGAAAAISQGDQRDSKEPRLIS